MSYRIRFEGCGTTSVCAQSRTQALTLAKGLMQRGRTNVVIQGPDGSTLAPPEPEAARP